MNHGVTAFYDHAPNVVEIVRAAAIGAECGPAGVELWNLWRTMETQVSGTLGFPGLGPQSTLTAPAVSLAAAALEMVSTSSAVLRIL